jgi:protein-tyrosine sulfotransferase
MRLRNFLKLKLRFERTTHSLRIEYAIMWIFSLALVVIYHLEFGCRQPQRRIFAYNRNMPIIFVGGVPRSGTTLMRAMLDAHPAVRCGTETHLIPKMIFFRNELMAAKRDQVVDPAVIDAAASAFILDIIVKHAKPAQFMCNKDPLVARYAKLMHSQFGRSKFILMLRDARGSVHSSRLEYLIKNNPYSQLFILFISLSVVTRKVSISGFNLSDYRDVFRRWNDMIEPMYNECVDLGPDLCMTVHYEQLVLYPETYMRRILSFLGVEWNDDVLHHEKFVGTEILLSSMERSTDQVVNPVNVKALAWWVGNIPVDVLEELETLTPMLARLGYDPHDFKPDYSEFNKTRLK